MIIQVVGDGPSIDVDALAPTAGYQDGTVPIPDDPRPSHDDDIGDAASRARLKAKMFGLRLDAPKIGPYAILKVLGEGGMGTVYSAYDDRLDRRMAVKRLKPSVRSDLQPRMLREAQALAKLSHPNVVPVYEVGTHQGQLYFAMEYVRGATLHRWQQDEEHSWLEVLEHYLQAGRGLAAAHAVGLVHRDFKPHNAVVGQDGRVRVLDFGLAAQRGETLDFGSESTIRVARRERALDTPLTETGTVMGTPAYMAPEQMLGGQVDHRSDQFSFCVALWEALYGQRPFEGADATEIQVKIVRGELSGTGRTEVPKEIRSLLARGLRGSPDERWPDLPALLDALQRFVPSTRGRKSRYSGGDAALAALISIVMWIPFLWMIDSWAIGNVPNRDAMKDPGAEVFQLLIIYLLTWGVGWTALTGFVARRRLLREERRRSWGWWRLVGLSWPALAMIVWTGLPAVAFSLGPPPWAKHVPLTIPVAPLASFVLLLVLERTLPRGRGLWVTTAAGGIVSLGLLIPLPWLMEELGASGLATFLLAAQLPALGIVTTGAAVALARAAEPRGGRS